MDKKDKLRIMNFVRLSFRQSQICQDVRALAVSKTKKGVRDGKMYVCSVCNQAFKPVDIQIHHKDPVVPYDMRKMDMSLQLYIERVYCPIENLVVVCKPCHKTL